MSSAPWDCQNIVAIQSNVLNSVSDDVFVLCAKYIFQYNVLSSIRLVKCTHQEYTCIHIGYVYTHEHDFVLAHEPIENGKQILTCSTCNLLYCKKCSTELSIPHNGLEAKSKKFRHLWAPKYNTASDRLNCHDLSAQRVEVDYIFFFRILPRMILEKGYLNKKD